VVVLRLLGLLLVLAVTMLTSESAGQQRPAPRWPDVQGRGVCMTDPGWCPLPYPEQTPVGAPCYCIMAGNRYVYGLTAPHGYRGHVNPYFNPHQTVPLNIK
jgi:hypothetical protein